MAKRKRKDKHLPWSPKQNPILDDSDGLLDVILGLLVESHVLADEPEFIDFRFDSNLAKATAEATLKKHDRAFQDAKKKGDEDLAYLQEKIFIETIDRLLTGSVRQDIMHRLSLLVNRLQTSEKDSDKLIIATTLESAFQDGKLPWGMSNLMYELFQRSLNIMDPDPDIDQAFKQMAEIIGEDLNPEELIEKMNDPEIMKEIEEKIDIDSDLFQKLSARSDNITDAFMDAILHGIIELDMFTEAEVVSYFDVIEDKMQAAGLDHDDVDSPAVGEIVRTSVTDRIEDIVTPERLQQMKEDLLLTFKNWSAQGNNYAGALFNQIRYLEDAPPEDSLFIQVLFFSQIKRFFGEISSEEGKTRKKTKRGRRRRKKR